MSLLIWSLDTPRNVLKTLGSVTKTDPDLPLQISRPGDVPAGTSIILALGAEKASKSDSKERPDSALGVLKALGAVPKGRAIGGLRKVLHRCDALPCPVLVSYAPGVGLVDYGMLVTLQTDLALAMRYARTGSIEPKLGDYRYVKDFGEFIARVEQLYIARKRPVAVAYDTETLGLDPYHPNAYLVSLQVCCEPGKVDMIRFASKDEEEGWTTLHGDQLEFLLTSPKIITVMANGKYDINWTHKRTGIDCTNFAFDTSIVGSMLNENRSNALDVHTKVYVPLLGGYSDAFDAVVDKSRIDLVSPEKLLPYGAGDGDATLQVYQAERKELLEDKRLTNFYVNLLHPAARAYEMIERTGALIDPEAFQYLESELTKTIDRTKAEAKKIMGGRIFAKHFNPKEPDKFNMAQPARLIDFIFSPLGLNLKPKMFTPGSADKGPGERIPSTAEEHMLMFQDEPEAKAFISILKEHNSATKTQSNFVAGRNKQGVIVKGFLAHLRSDNRFHPSYFLHNGDDDEEEGGTNTGRLSARQPAFQTIPAHTRWAKLIRDCYIAPPGMLVAGGDYSQGELRLMACLSNDEAMLDAYLNSLDLHAITASMVNDLTYEEIMALKATDKLKFKEVRQGGKAGNFGLIYGMQAPGFVTYARRQYEVIISLEAAVEFRNNFFQKYKSILTYHKEYIAFAKQNGYVRSPLGRVRHLPMIDSSIWAVSSKAERQAINAPNQATLSDMSLLASGESYKRKWHLEMPQFGMVHDQNLFYVPEDNAVELCKRQKELMENLPFHKFNWKPQLNFPVDFTLGKTLGSQEELKL